MWDDIMDMIVDCSLVEAQKVNWYFKDTRVFLKSLVEREKIGKV